MVEMEGNLSGHGQLSFQVMCFIFPSKVGCATGGWTLVLYDFFSSAVENVEFVRDVYYLYPLTR